MESDTTRTGFARPELSVVIPAFNEEATVAEVVRDHAAVCERLGIAWEIVALDDGSVDGTASELERLRADIPRLRVLRHEQNLGIGRSLLDLYRAADGTWIFFNAADGQVPASELVPLCNARAGMDLVVGRRTPRRDPAHRVAFAAIYSALMRALFGVTVRDVHSVKLYRADALRESWPSSTSSFGEDEILIALHRANAPVREIPIAHRPRRAGHAHGGSLRIAIGAITDLLLFALTRCAPLLFTLFLVALAIRLAAQFALGVYERPDTWEYDAISRSILTGEGYRYHWFGAEWLTFGFPAFPLLLVALHWLGGGPGSYGVVMLGIALLSAALAPLAYAIARQLYDARAAAVAGAIVAVDPPLVLFSARVHELTLDAVLLGAILLSVLRYIRGHRASGIVLGILVGISFIARPTIALLGALLGASAAVRWRSSYMLVGAGIAVAIAAPWSIRNAVVLGGLGAASPYNCVTLWMGNNPNASGGPVTPEGVSVFDVMDPALRDRVYGRPEQAQGSIFCAEVMASWRADPVGAIAWWATKFGYFWWFPPSAGAWYPARWIDVYRLGYVLEFALVLAGAAAVLGRGWRLGLAIVAVQLVVIAAAQSVAYVEGRHRLVVEPTLAALAGIGVTSLIRAFRTRTTSAPRARSAAVAAAGGTGSDAGSARAARR